MIYCKMKECDAITEGEYCERYCCKCEQADYKLMIIKRKMTIYFSGCFDFQVLYGLVTVRRYRFRGGKFDENRFRRVSVPYKLSTPIEFCGDESDSIEAVNWQRLKWRITEVSDEVDKVKDNFAEGDSLILLRFKSSPVASIMKEIYKDPFFVPTALNFRFVHLSQFCAITLKSWKAPVSTFGEDVVAAHYRNIVARSEKEGKTITMIVGDKGVGKSTLAREIVNFVLDKELYDVYYLDADIGQAEFTPPGCISLHKVAEPMLGSPAFTQLSSCSNSYFFGDISPANDVALYQQLIIKLVNVFRSTTLSRSLLIINYLGWIYDRGTQLLNDLINSVSPDIIIRLKTVDDQTIERPDEGFPGNVKYSSSALLLDCKTKRDVMIDSLSPADHRKCLTIGYFAHLLPAPSPSAFPNIWPLTVRFKAIAIYMHPDISLIPDTYLFAALNATLVALCSWERKPGCDMVKRRILDDPEMVEIIHSDTVYLKFYGFGFIRAIDVEKKLFYMITPVPKATLKHVNTFARGTKINLPSIFFTSQEFKDAPYSLALHRNDSMVKWYEELRNVTFLRGRPTKKMK
ncbi:hypothetical protein AB6A40_004801 [Gnathostoma spinigerum]|uniref:Uncharacterized protein n=1 Tax=Gnathostoma spinigerum TaxID=75299 RepID=A0ABD6EN42_9BILA